jgi:hypothetical protein
MFRRSSTPYWGSSFRVLTSAAALSVVVASAGPAMAFLKPPMTLDLVTAVEGYPVERHYYLLRFPTIILPGGLRQLFVTARTLERGTGGILPTIRKIDS